MDHLSMQQPDQCGGTVTRTCSQTKRHLPKKFMKAAYLCRMEAEGSNGLDMLWSGSSPLYAWIPGSQPGSRVCSCCCEGYTLIRCPRQPLKVQPGAACAAHEQRCCHSSATGFSPKRYNVPSSETSMLHADLDSIRSWSPSRYAT